MAFNDAHLAQEPGDSSLELRDYILLAGKSVRKGGGGAERLGGDASLVETGTPERAFAYEGHFKSPFGGFDGGFVTARTRTDNK